MRHTLLGGLIALLLASAPAQAERRLALLVGIDDYRNVPKLQKAVGDAQALGTTLEGAGFDVDLRLNPDRRGLNAAISALVGRVQPGDTVLVHFSGHGVQVDSENYLLPADVPAADGIDREDMRSEAVTLSHLLRRIRDAGAGTQIVILDACRNNPFGEAASRGLGGARGLAPVAPPRGTFVMYSAATDQLARDRLSDEDAEPTSVFTRTLLRKITVQGKPITDVAREVRDEVAALAKQVNHEQRPAYYDELSGGQFYFVPPRPAAAVEPKSAAPEPSPVVPQSAPGLGSMGSARDAFNGLTPLEAFNLAKALDTPVAYDAFLKQFPDGFLATLAREHREGRVRRDGEASQSAERQRRTEREARDQGLREERDRLAREERDRLAREQALRQERDRVFRDERDRILREERERVAWEERERIAREQAQAEARAKQQRDKLAALPPPTAPRPPERSEPERVAASSRSGWTLNYSAKLLKVREEADDLFDPAKRSYNTIWNSKEHGDEVVIYVQVSANSQCRTGAQYAEEQIAARRGRIGEVREIRDPSGQRQSFVVEGRGFVTNRGVLDRATIDFVTHRRGDPSTLIHLGGRFPPETVETYKAEILRMLNSMELPKVDPFKRLCT
jgi:uncharacterized caspase-like protein